MHLFIDKLNLSMDTWRDKCEQKITRVLHMG